MSSWAERVHRRAADLGSVVTSCGHPGSSAPTYPYRLEKVKFGVPLEEVCKSNDNIPGPLLVLILKLNKESPNRRDVFRAPGHQGAMKKLIHFLQSGRLVNVDNYSVYTIASVLKKFLRKIPNGIFGRSGEEELFAIIELENETEQTERLHRLLTSLPKYTQHLLVLLFGTFRVIASNAAHAGTGMTSEALGVSVAPSFFQSCVSDGKTARMQDVLKFKVATKIMKHIIDKFATHDLFGRDNYEYYARVTGRILKVQDEWICSFQYPPPPRGKLAQQKYALQHSLEAEKTWLQCQCERWGLLAQEESRSTPALLTSSSSALDNSVLSLGVTPEHSFIESCARLSVSLEGPGLFAMTSSPIPKRNDHELLQRTDDVDADDDDDEENYADDDDEDDDYIRELEISNDDDIENNVKEIFMKMKPTGGGGGIRGGGGGGGGGGGAIERDKHGNDYDEVTIAKRRYRQNRKKVTPQMRMQHQRRLRSGSKSLEGGGGGDRMANVTNENDNGNIAANTGAAAAAAASNINKASAHHSTVAAAAAAATATATAAGTAGKSSAKRRTCSRCNRGIRHSSSCSSTSGGGAGGGGGGAASGSVMTMEELRAVNRYAESTKSLSYLPQVHERQTARMRTRSEWFLGPRDGIIGSQLPPNTCSSCVLAVQQQQQLQQQQQYQQHHHQKMHRQFHSNTHHGYLGGGSTRDMRSHRNHHYNGSHNDMAASGGDDEGDDDDDDDDEDDDADDAAAAAADAFYMFYKQRHHQQLQQQQQQQQRRQRQQYLQTEHMDTDDSIDYDMQLHSTSVYLTPPPEQQAAITCASGRRNEVHLLGNCRRYLDTNSVGNIRLSNSAESVQYATRRPSSRRLIGINVPRQYPLRSSLRRNKEKQIGNGGSGNGNNISDSNIKSTSLGVVGGIFSSNNQLPSVRNSIAECCGNILTPTFPSNHLKTRSESLELKQSLRVAARDGSENLVTHNSDVLMDTGVVVPHCENVLIYTTAVMGTISPVLSTTSLIRNTDNVAAQQATHQRHHQQQRQHSEDVETTAALTTTTIPTITFKPPRV